MRNFLLCSAFALITLSSSAQCSKPVCDHVTKLGATDGSTSYSGDQCFEAADSGTTVGLAVNYNSWHQLSYAGKFKVSKPINMPHDGNIFSTGELYMSKISMSGHDSIFIAGTATLVSIVANNYPNVMVLQPGACLTIGGISYMPGDTLFTPGNLSNIVTVVSCGDALPLNIRKFSAYVQGMGILATWEAAGMVDLQYSSDGREFITIYTGLSGSYFLDAPSDMNLFRLHSGGEYSGTLYVPMKPCGSATLDASVFDLSGRRLGTIPTGIPYIQYGKVNFIVQ